MLQLEVGSGVNMGQNLHAEISALTWRKVLYTNGQPDEAGKVVQGHYSHEG